MDGVMTPLVINCFYFCDPDGHTSYVQTKEAMQVDERTPLVKQLIFRNLECRNCHIAAAYIHGLPEQKIEKVSMENIKFTYAENASAGVPAMMENMEQVSKMGVYVNNVKELSIDNVTVEGQRGEAFITYNVEQIIKK
jgi:polygalacturonase